MFGGRYFAKRFFAGLYFPPAEKSDRPIPVHGGWFGVEIERSRRRVLREHVASGGLHLAGSATVSRVRVFGHAPFGSARLSGRSAFAIERFRFAGALAEDDLFLLLLA